jgi:hypothetical protein
LNMLPFWLPPRLRLSRMHRTRRPISRAAPITDPTTMPAMAPFESPPRPAAGAGVLLAVAVTVAAGVVNVMVGVMEGSVTPAHLDEMFAE